jgi:hypothetical protein
MASSSLIIRRRARLALSLALTLLPLGGCSTRPPSGRYQKAGLTFEHLAGWAVTKDNQGGVRHLTVEGPEHAIVTIAVFPPRLDPSLETFVATARTARGAAVEQKLTVGGAGVGVKLGAEAAGVPPGPVERSVAGKMVRGLEEHFTIDVAGVPVPHTAQFLKFTLSDRALMVMSQAADSHRGATTAGFQKILDSIALGP